MAATDGSPPNVRTVNRCGKKSRFVDRCHARTNPSIVSRPAYHYNEASWETLWIAACPSTCDVNSLPGEKRSAGSARLAPMVALTAVLTFSVLPASRSWADGEVRPSAVEPLLATLKRTAPGDGSQAAAAAAWRQLAQADAGQLPTILAALDDAGPLATNWIRTAAEAIVERTHSASALPRAELRRFLLDRRHAAAGRRFAYETLLAGDPTLADRVLPTMLDDPSLELRRDAVDRVLDAADLLGEKDAAKRNMRSRSMPATSIKSAGRPTSSTTSAARSILPGILVLSRAGKSLDRSIIGIDLAMRPFIRPSE